MAPTNITLGSKTGTSLAGTVVGLWATPAAVVVDSLRSTDALLTDILTASTVNPDPPVLTLASTAAAGLVVDTPVRVVVNAASPSGNSTLGLKLRLTFFGVAPRQAFGFTALLSMAACTWWS